MKNTALVLILMLPQPAMSAQGDVGGYLIGELVSFDTSLLIELLGTI